MSVIHRAPGEGNGGEDLDGLLQEFKHDSSGVGAYSSEEPVGGMIESLDEETLALNQRFNAIVSYIGFLGEFFGAIAQGGEDGEIDGALDRISHGASALARLYSSAGEAVVRYRGRSGLEASAGQASFDYTVQAGLTALDTPTLKGLVSIDASEASRLGDKLSLSFIPLPKLGIYMFSTAYGKASGDDLFRMRSGLKMLSRYYKTIPPLKGKAPSGPQDFIVTNEHGAPDPNLTILAGVNNVKGQSMRELVKKVGGLMASAPAGSNLARCVSVYDAIFLDPKLRERLKKPAVEVNNPRRMLAGQGGGGALVSPEQAALMREASALHGADPLKGARTMDCLFLRDYRDVNSAELLGSLNDVNDFIVKTRNPAVKTEALRRIRMKLDKAPEYLMDAFSIRNGRVAPLAGGDDEAAPMQPELLRIVAFFKKRSETNEKIHKILYEPVEFGEADVAALAADLMIGAQEAGQALDLLQKCFKSGGQFVRGTFERNIPFFAKHEKRMFELLWGFLKDIGSRDDRVALLDSLQLLISKMKRPDIALDVILSDFISFPEVLDYSERNGLMLANVLIRKYNKELGNRIERTPEEVLLARDGISAEMASFIADFVDKEQDRFLRKMRTIHQELVDRIGRDSGEDNAMSLRFLVSLEREIYILLSLSGGLTGRRIIRSAVREYGDPHSHPYESAKNQDELKSIFQLFQLAVRGLGRFRAKEDAPLFEKIRRRTVEFLSIKPSLLPKDSVKNVMEHVSAAIVV
jgi:hypothetical protein